VRVHGRTRIVLGREVWIRTGFVLPYLPEAVSQNEVVSRVIVGAAGDYSRGGYDVVIDGILGPWALEPFRLYSAFAQLGDLEQHVIDSTAQTPEETATAIRSHRNRLE
jgi:hypothetical protein